MTDQTPGYKAEGTSKEAAESMKGAAHALRLSIMGVLTRNLTVDAGWTADEMAEYLNVSILSVRPRFSELRAGGLIVDSGQRRRNKSDHKAVVWRAVRGPIKKKPRKMKSIGNPALWGQMMQAIYAYAKSVNDDPAGYELSRKVNDTSLNWAYDMVERIAKIQKKDAAGGWSGPEEIEDLQTVTGSYEFHD